jgi:fructose-bisphosphate aldolase class II
LFGIFSTLARDVLVPVTLHLDHCPDRSVISDCLAGGWNSVLFDAHEVDVAENLRQTQEVVAEARRYGAHVEGPRWCLERGRPRSIGEGPTWSPL